MSKMYNIITNLNEFLGENTQEHNPHYTEY